MKVNRTRLSELFVALILVLMLTAIIFFEGRKDFGQSGQLSVVVDGETPISRILIGGERNIVIAKFRFFAKDEPFLVKQLRVGIGDRQSNQCVEAVKINYPRQDGGREDKVGVLDGKVLGAADFSNLNFFVPEKKPAILTVSVDLWRIVSDGCSGSKITASLVFDFFEAIGQKSNERLTAHGGKKDDGLGSGATVNAFPMTIRKTKPTVTLAAGSPAGADVPKTNQEILRFNISADQGDDLEILEIDFCLTASDQDANGWSNITALADKLTLYERDDLTTPLNGRWTLADTRTGLSRIIYAKFIFSPRKTISAGVSKLFSLLMNTSGARRSNSEGDGDKIIVEIIAMTNIGGTLGLLNGIVWNETGVGAATEINGANVTNLPVTGGTIIY